MIKKESALPLFPASGPCGNPANRDAGQRKIFAGCYVTAPYVIGRQSKALPRTGSASLNLLAAAAGGGPSRQSQRGRFLKCFMEKGPFCKRAISPMPPHPKTFTVFYNSTTIL